MTSRCRHIRVSGHRCTTPALNNESFCFYHSAHRLDSKARAAGYPPPTLRLPPLEDRASIQVAIHLILDQVASGMLHPKRGGLLLYGVQIAATLLRHQPTQPELHAEPPIQNPVHDPCEGIIAAEDHAALPSPTEDPQAEQDNTGDSQTAHTAAQPGSNPPNPSPASPHPTPGPADSGDIPAPWRNLGPTDPIPDLSALRDPRFCLPCL